MTKKNINELYIISEAWYCRMLVMRYNLTERQISERLGIPKSTVHDRLSRSAYKDYVWTSFYEQAYKQRIKEKESK